MNIATSSIRKSIFKISKLVHYSEIISVLGHLFKVTFYQRVASERSGNSSSMKSCQRIVAGRGR